MRYAVTVIAAGFEKPQDSGYAQQLRSFLANELRQRAQNCRRPQRTDKELQLRTDDAYKGTSRDRYPNFLTEIRERKRVFQ